MAGFYLSLSGRTSQLPAWCSLPPLGSCSLAGTAVWVHVRVPRRHASRLRSSAALTSFLSHPHGLTWCLLPVGPWDLEENPVGPQ